MHGSSDKCPGSSSSVIYLLQYNRNMELTSAKYYLFFLLFFFLVKLNEMVANSDGECYSRIYARITTK